MGRIISSLVLLLFISGISKAATYNYYFSDDAAGNAAGNDTTGDGSISTPWKTLNKVQTAIDALSATDIVNIYFDRGDTWSMNTAAVSTATVYGVTVGSTDPVVNFAAYGTGNRPIFDGQVTDFSTVPSHNATTGPLRWNRIFELQRDGCSFTGLEISNVYGHAIYLKPSDNNLFTDLLIHHFGGSGITMAFQYGTEGNEVSHSIFHTGQELFRHAKRTGWGGAIDFEASGYGGASMCKDHYVHHNIVYDIYGEGINAANSIVEYNIVGDTGSVAINTVPHDFDGLDSTIRYNVVTFSNRANSDYTNLSGSSPQGIRVFDEDEFGDNSQGNVLVHDNIIINRDVGIKMYCSLDCGNPWASVKIYNNVVIDSVDYNYRMVNPEEATVGEFYNNSSIMLGRTSPHVSDGDSQPDAGWTIYDNHYWTDGGSPTVDTDWDTTHDVTDPLLLETSTTYWTTLDGATYYEDMSPIIDLNPPSNSPIYQLNVLLDRAIDDLDGTAGGGMVRSSPLLLFNAR